MKNDCMRLLSKLVNYYTQIQPLLPAGQACGLRAIRSTQFFV